MDTNDLIRGLARDTAAPLARLPATLGVSLAVAVVVAALVWMLALGPRPDIAAAAATPRFLFKFVATLALAVPAVLAWRAAARPEARLAPLLAALLVAPVLMLGAVAVEFAAVPAGARMARMMGTNAMLCLTFIPLIGAVPLALLMVALRRGAPQNPTLAGMLCGLAAGGIAATFYAAHCFDDSPFFVATWYTLAILLLAAAGALAGRRWLRW
jgi:hypothetical protein